MTVPEGLPCPNPTCDYVTPRSALSGQAALVCPRCGKEFLFRMTAPAVPPAMPIQATAPPLEAPAAPLELRRGRRGRPRYRSRTWLNWSVLAVVLVLVGAAGVRLYRWYAVQHAAVASDSVDGELVVAREYNCKFVIPPGWVEDDGLKVLVNANVLTLRRATPASWFALAAKDYRTRTPRPAEAQQEILSRLRSYFNPTNFEWAAGEDSNIQVAGQPVQRLTFQGEANSVAMTGEIDQLTAKGIAYWLVCWAPESQIADVSREAAGLFRRFGLLNSRRNWSEKRPPVHTFTGPGHAYTLRDSEGVWTVDPEPREMDPDAELALRARDAEAPLSVARMAQVLVLHLPAQKDPAAALAAARKHFETQERKDNPGIKIELVRAPAGGSEQKIGNAQGSVVRLHVAGDSRKRLILLAAIRLPERVLVLQCDCPWDGRSLWERDFTQLLGTFHLQAG